MKTTKGASLIKSLFCYLVFLIFNLFYSFKF